MANYTQVRSDIDSMSKAAQILPFLQDIYARAQRAQGAINLYTGGTDTTFNEAVEDIFDAGERTELNQMIGDLNTLVTEWNTNHSALLATELE